MIKIENFRRVIMKIQQGYCTHCEKECAAIGNFRTVAFTLNCLLFLLIFAPLIVFPIMFSGSFYEYHCPHCGRKIKHKTAPKNKEYTKKSGEFSVKESLKLGLYFAGVFFLIYILVYLFI